MTATPIPRTVTMTLFGDLDVSTLRDSPPGRQKVNTYLANEDQRAKWWDFFRKKLREGRQGYVVTPLVEESDSGRGRQPGGDLRDAGQRRAGGLSARADPRPHDAGRKGRRDGRLPQRRDPGAGLHVGGRGGRGRAQRHADDDRERRSASAWPSSTSFAAGSAAASFPASAASSAIRRPRNRASG